MRRNPHLLVTTAALRGPFPHLPTLGQLVRPRALPGLLLGPVTRRHPPTPQRLNLVLIRRLVKLPRATGSPNNVTRVKLAADALRPTGKLNHPLRKAVAAVVPRTKRLLSSHLLPLPLRAKKRVTRCPRSRGLLLISRRRLPFNRPVLTTRSL